MVFAGLLRREWLEHSSAFLWAPASVLAVMLLASVSILLGGDVMTDVSSAERQELHERLGKGAQESGPFEALAAMTLDAAGSTDEELSSKLEALQHGIAEPFRYIFVIVAFFALIGCIYDERKDRSVLFWKSMPVSDASTVLSKIVFVLWLAPLATVAAILLAQFASVVLSSMFVESGMGGRIWRLSGLWSNPFELLVFYGLYGLWLLPFASWAVLKLPMVSGISRSDSRSDGVRSSNERWIVSRRTSATLKSLCQRRLRCLFGRRNCSTSINGTSITRLGCGNTRVK